VTENDRRHVFLSSSIIVEGHILRTFHLSTWSENLKFHEGHVKGIHENLKRFVPKLEGIKKIWMLKRYALLLVKNLSDQDNTLAGTLRTCKG